MKSDCNQSVDTRANTSSPFLRKLRLRDSSRNKSTSTNCTVTVVVYRLYTTTEQYIIPSVQLVQFCMHYFSTVLHTYLISEVAYTLCTTAVQYNVPSVESVLHWEALVHRLEQRVQSAEEYIHLYPHSKYIQLQFRFMYCEST